MGEINLKCSVLNVSREPRLILLLKGGWREGEAFGNEEGKAVGSERF
jgi:hypothetical protein